MTLPQAAQQPLSLTMMTAAEAELIGELAFVAYGRPQPGGSKRAVPVRRNGIATGRINVIDAGKHTMVWRQEVASAAAIAMRARRLELLRGPLMLDVVFYFARPRGHYGTGANADRVRLGAPRYPSVKPDCTKLIRAVEDALTGVCWRDDAQVVQQVAGKFYGEPERCEVIVRLPK